MNTGKTLFAQLMDFLPWTTFTRIVDRYGGDHRVRTGVGLVWKIEVIDLVRFWCRDGRPKTAIRDNGPLQGRILSRRQGRAGEGGNAPHRQKRYDAVS